MAKKQVTVDFETKPIEARPEYPPRPVGVAIKHAGKPGKYLHWGHNLGKPNCEPAKAGAILADIWRDADEIIFHNGKFDLDVAQKHFGLALPPWHKIHDSMFSLFLDNPHALSLSLKPAAEVYLHEPPTERNAVFDWLAEQGIIQKPRTVDGKLVYQKDAGRYIWLAPPHLVGPYAVGDCDRAYGIHKLLHGSFDKRMLAAYDRERRLMPILLENERQGMRVDVPRLEADLKDYEAALVKVDVWLRKKLRALALNLDSDEDVATALKKCGEVTEFPKTPTGKDSISKKNLTAGFFKTKLIWCALYYRNALATVLSMSMRPWLEQAQANNGYIYTEWNQVRQSHGQDGSKGARSGRVTCSRFQNITKDFLDRGDEYGVEGDCATRRAIGLPALPLVRKYLMPDAGHLFGHVDYNQQEMRLVAHYEDGRLAQAYRNDPKMDVHTFVQKLIKEVTGKHYERRPVKIVDFRTVYGGGASGLAEGLKWPIAQARELIQAWKQALPDVVSLDKYLKDRFYQGEPLRTYGGRIYHCKPPAMAKKGPRKGEMVSFEYTALNYLIQPSGADVTKEAIIRYHDHPKKDSRMIVTVHDEVNISAPKHNALDQLRLLQECMESVTIDVPWKTDGDLRTSWGEKVTK